MPKPGFVFKSGRLHRRSSYRAPPKRDWKAQLITDRPVNRKVSSLLLPEYWANREDAVHRDL